MRRYGWKKELLSLSFSVLIAAELIPLIDAVTVYLDKKLPGAALWCVFAGILLSMHLCKGLSVKGKGILAAAIPAVTALVCLSAFFCWNSFRRDAVYADTDAGKEAVYARRKVMLIIPHEDDEINVLGGVIEAYTQYGSDVYVVFLTNGDYEGIGERRIEEAVKACGFMGVPEENVIFLGYGDQWSEDGPHLYNAEDGVVRESYFGYTATYGTESHPAYHEGNPYTRENLLGDMESVLLEYRPEVVICSDYDDHIDHKSTTLVFEKAMGRILKSTPEYTPVVLKGYAYNTAWHAAADFYADNMLSTQNIFTEPYSQQPEIYRWEERVRLPVKAGGLSRSLLSASGCEALAIHASQRAYFQAQNVINGDRVLWRRNTTSLCYGADITVSSGTAEYLNDFMLLENNDLLDEDRMPFDGVWSPEEDDGEKTVTVTFPQKTNLYSIVLYDDPDPEQNVKKVTVLFDDGTVRELGPLDPGGAASVFTVKAENVASFRLAVAEWEGERAGLTEIEAYREAPSTEMKLIKLMDSEENFVYDYWIGRDGRAEFGLYAYGDVPRLSEADYVLECSNDRCGASITEGKITVECPTGESCVVTLTSRDGEVADSVTIRNPGTPERGWTRMWQRIEKDLFEKFCARTHRKTMIYQVWKAMSDRTG